ncbi:MAG: hypothetical protein WCV79_00740 [Candidatus Paceibacterota bacterium]
MKHSYANLPLFFLAAVVATCGMLLYIYMYNAVGAAYSRALVARAIVNSQKLDSVAERSTVQLFEKTASARNRLSSLFVKDVETVSFIEDLENIGTVVGSSVSLSSVSADDTTNMAQGTFAKIGAHIDVTGSWQGVIRTLMMTEVLPYHVSIDTVTLTAVNSAPDTKTTATWRASYNVKATILVTATSTKTK